MHASSLPPLMKAALAEAYGGPDVIVLREVPLPKAKPGEMLVRVRASAVNSADARARSLSVPQPLQTAMRLALGLTKPRRPILGTVFAGTVEVPGSKGLFQKGDRVFGCAPGMAFGCHAQYVAVPADGPVAKMPEGSAFEEMASLPFGGATALFFLSSAGAAAGRHALIYGAAGAVGSMAVQAAKAMGMRVTAVAGGRHAQLLAALKPDAFLDYTAPGFALPQKAFDIVFDAVGRLPKKQALPLLRRGGRYATTGGLAVSKETAAHMRQLADWYKEGQIKPVIGQRFAFGDIRKAHALADTGHKWGSAVVTLP